MNLAAVLHGCTLLWWYTFVVGAIVIVHELGHYFVARLFGVLCKCSASGSGPGYLDCEEVKPISDVRLYLLAGT
jgi:hypothetical protein